MHDTVSVFDQTNKNKSIEEKSNQGNNDLRN